MYAIKEFKAGPLTNFAWMHNKLATTNSFYDSIDKLHRMALTPKKYTTATAIEALRNAEGSISKMTSLDLLDKYGKEAEIDSILCDEFKFAIQRKIITAWKRRRLVTSKVVHPLPCYLEASPKLDRGLIALDPIKCTLSDDCCMRNELIAKKYDLEKLKSTINTLTQKPENIRRSKVLRQLIRKPKDKLTNQQCRDLGDAVFAFFAPIDTVILTTNTKDHKPLANVLGKDVADTNVDA